MIKFIEDISEKTTLMLGNYTLLVFLFVQFFVVSFFPVEWHKILYNIVITLIYLNLVVVIKDYRTTLLSYVLILIILDWVFTIFKLPVLSKISFILNILLFFIIVIKFITLIAQSRKVDINIILDSINGYLLLAVLCTMMIKLIMSINPEAFAFNEAGILKGGVSRVSEFQYYGLVTLSTLGYGEITPITPSARSVATFIAVSGQLYVAIIIALLVGKFSGQSSNAE